MNISEAKRNRRVVCYDTPQVCRRSAYYSKLTTKEAENAKKGLAAKSRF
jgi:hypothetical protein